MVAIDSRWSVPPHIQPPMAHVPSATRETLSCVPGISTNSVSTVGIWTWVDGDMGLNPPGEQMPGVCQIDLSDRLGSMDVLHNSESAASVTFAMLHCTPPHRLWPKAQT